MPSERALSNPRDFRRVLQHGRRARRNGVTAFVLERSPATDSTRLGLAVRAGTAVARNRMRRRLRAAARSFLPRAGFDVVLQSDERVRSRPAELLWEDVRDALRTAISESS